MGLLNERPIQVMGRTFGDTLLEVAKSVETNGNASLQLYAEEVLAVENFNPNYLCNDFRLVEFMTGGVDHYLSKGHISTTVDLPGGGSHLGGITFNFKEQQVKR